MLLKIFFQGRLVNLSCSSVPSFVVSITSTTQVTFVLLCYKEVKFVKAFLKLVEKRSLMSILNFGMSALQV